MKINLEGQKARITIKKLKHGSFDLHIQGYTKEIHVPYDKYCIGIGSLETFEAIIETHDEA